ncbi:1-deoxy-D-xylulose-5-phosphate reductoisomerase [Niveibacterium microcysteis]|uniref:1-deoxy-D-xylulose 5-phosphate reductoisomerase n=2 Tax=Niveibacterium microcysteis TaxID=2811415 RepID=A0ABX7M1E9_9RHOO|nr:1-deoxy-D-xylulose-5-phosphate reductoisomerase [Niveibacterium microcysteis]QSI75134.1 1-deoxy-D-xylulose-5-phosphate reductoisomerase [Niveibacterium microcysteis]
MMQHLTILGATGSIGTSTLDVVARHPDRYRVFALTAFRQLEKLAEQIAAFRPTFAVVPDLASRESLRLMLIERGVTCELLVGEGGLCEVATHAEVTTVMAAIVGAVGLPPTLAAVRAGKRVLLANKEALVMSGRLFMDEARQSGATVLPIDSEHNAVFQSLPSQFEYGLEEAGVTKVLLTASGGPFRTWPIEQLKSVTPDQAVAHPNWVMGRKISVDSATMMNKGLEVIEARWLFGIGGDRIDVVIHPQSVIHSMVQYADGSVVAQLGNPDMRTPIAHALAYPQRIASGVAPLDFASIAALTFETPDLNRFPCLRLAYAALKADGLAPTVLNAANEIAVSAFLDRQISYLDIASTVEAVLDSCDTGKAESLEDVLVADGSARRMAQAFIDKRLRGAA